MPASLAGRYPGKYYGGRVALYILGTFYVTMAAAGYVVEGLFGALGIVPTQRDIVTFTEGPSLNYTTVLKRAVPGARARAVLAVSAHRWSRHAANDERA